MMIETKKGAKIELIAKDGNVHAIHNGSDMGAVVEMANKELGWHLRAGTVALAVADKYVADVKQLIAKTKADNYNATRTADQRVKDAEIDGYFDSLAKINNANYGSK